MNEKEKNDLFYVCSLIDEDIRLHDHTDVQWFNISDDISTIDWVPADVQVIEAFLLTQY